MNSKSAKIIFGQDGMINVILKGSDMEEQILNYEKTKVGVREALRRAKHRKVEINERGDILVFERGLRTLNRWVLMRRMVNGRLIEHRRSLLGQV